MLTKSLSSPPDDLKSLRYGCKLLYAEWQYRRRRRWEVFKWASTLLIASSGAIVALQAGTNHELNLKQQILLTLLVSILTSCSALWWRRHHAYAARLLRQISVYEQKLGRFTQFPIDNGRVNALTTLVLLGLATIAIIWFSR